MSNTLSDVRSIDASGPNARVGSRVSRKWRLDSLLASGGMGAVYAATHRNGARAAIKIFHAQLSGCVEARRRFLAEGSTANKVPHSGVVSVLDDGELESGEPFLVMELLEGETLYDRYAQRAGDVATVDPASVLHIAHEVLDILVAMHDCGVVHCDINPQNIFLSRDGQVKLLDFGVARVEGSCVSDRAIIGTPAFMSPEQAGGESDDIDARTDLWAMAATLFWMLSGRYVHEADSVEDEIALARSKAARSVSECAPSLPPSLVTLVDRALAFDPMDRFDDARAMQRAVRWASEEVRRSVPVRAPTVRRLPPPQPAVDPAGISISLTMDHSSAKSTPRRWPLYLALGAIFALGAGVYRSAAISSTHPPATAAPILYIAESNVPNGAPDRWKPRAEEGPPRSGRGGAIPLASAERSFAPPPRSHRGSPSREKKPSSGRHPSESKIPVVGSRSGISLSVDDFIP